MVFFFKDGQGTSAHVHVCYKVFGASAGDEERIPMDPLTPHLHISLQLVLPHKTYLSVPPPPISYGSLYRNWGMIMNL
jgi:hypothetical protein